MTGFCVREMRREYRGVSRLYTGTAMLFLLAFACLGVVMRVRDADARLRLLLIGLDFVVVLVLLSRVMPVFAQVFSQLGTSVSGVTFEVSVTIASQWSSTRRLL